MLKDQNGRFAKRVPLSVQEDILDAYINGEKIDAIASEYGVSRAYPGVLAKRLGVSMRMTRDSRSRMAKSAIGVPGGEGRIYNYNARRVGFVFDATQYDQIRTLAEKHRCSMSTIVRAALNKYLNSIKD